MAGNVIRQRNAIVAIKGETTPGVDAWGGIGVAANLATDFLRADIAITLNQTQVANTEVTGTPDQAAPIPGGVQAQVILTCPLRGSGTPGTPPGWGKAAKACGLAETITAAAIPATTVTAATANTLTLPAPFVQTAEAYRGMPLLLSVNPALATDVLVTDYAGGVATLGSSFAPTLDITTKAGLLANVLYSPILDLSTAATATIRIYMDGLLWDFVGAIGNPTLSFAVGGLCTIKFDFKCLYQPPTPAPVPVGFTVDQPTPVVFRNGISRLGGQLARVSTASIDLGNITTFPDDPENSEGFDAALITSRKAVGTLDPLQSVASTIARVLTWKAGGLQSLVLGAGTTAGNMFAMVAPAVQYTTLAVQARNELMSENLGFSAPTPGAPFSLCAY
jgi:hypothetical protein